MYHNREALYHFEKLDQDGPQPKLHSYSALPRIRLARDRDLYAKRRRRCLQAVRNTPLPWPNFAPTFLAYTAGRSADGQRQRGVKGQMG
jgi:hypothetical protein